jgi:hypothetical protein
VRGEKSNLSTKRELPNPTRKTKKGKWVNREQEKQRIEQTQEWEKKRNWRMGEKKNRKNKKNKE